LPTDPNLGRDLCQGQIVFNTQLQDLPLVRRQECAVKLRQPRQSFPLDERITPKLRLRL
jgi:hypothetical protein